MQEVLPIIAQEDPYMLHLLGRQKYIDIVKTTIVEWVEALSSFLFVVYEFIGEHGANK
jgi:hypothetical protein